MPITPSERFFALVTKETEAHHGNVSAGIAAAARWAAANLPVYAINLILTTPTELWALRYPDTHDLYVLQRCPGGPHGNRHLEHTSTAGRIRARSSSLVDRRAVVVASERMDEDPAWQNLRSGELLHVGPDQTATRRIVLDHPPRHPLTLDDLGSHAAASQQGQ
ncbi:class II glutamine amidotransferase [Amycolatopsis circi]|uniref:class II glutamine amidotransferase n=1 Tax=Amycolatopsis circi TaxID=871959 RepID=UPI001FCA1B99|nr:class II glutamine amidotransferase [Amycolatopsis circi]